MLAIWQHLGCRDEIQNPNRKIIQNYLDYGHCPSPGILKSRKYVLETGSVSVLR
jgi:hypothetical protein